MPKSEKIKFEGREKPYTRIGIRRLTCFRCGGLPGFQWTICANNNNFVPICRTCDVALNKLVLRWMGFKNWKVLIQNYEESIP